MGRWLKRWWPALVIPLVAVIAFALGWWLKPERELLPHEEARQVTALNTEQGLGESDLRRRFGEPLLDKNGYHPLNGDLLEPRLDPEQPQRTLCFRVNNGKLWVWLGHRGGRWTCFRSFWYDDTLADRYQPFAFQE